MTESVIFSKQPVAFSVEQGKRYHWCRCGRSKKQPLCDGSHKDTGIQPETFIAEKTSTVYLCQCKQTQNAPFCDGSHAKLK